MKIRAFPKRRDSGFTLVEILVATSLATLVGAGAYTLLTATLKLYAENFSLNDSHITARMPLERMMREINDSGCSPVLVDQKGADIAGDGPAPGVRFCTPASSAPYSLAAAAIATAKTVSINVNLGQAKPRASDILYVQASPAGQPGNGIQVEITAIAGSASPYNATLKTALGADVGANNSALILQQGGFIAAGGRLRYYNKAMSEARDGATAFNMAGNYRSLAQVESAPGDTQPNPFSYASSDHRLLKVDLRARSATYSKRVTDFNTFFDMKSSIAIKSAYLDPSKLGPIQ